MPSETVEQIALAIYAARGAGEPPRAWRKWEDLDDAARNVWLRCARAALTAAMGEEKPVGFFDTLSDEQKAAALAYDGPDTLMPADAPVAHPSREDVVEEAIPDAAVEAFLLSFYPGMTVEEMAMHNGEDLRPGARTALAAAIRKLGERS